jgi:hypothetical protein
MNSTHIFSIHRVGALIKRDLMENQKTYLKAVGGLMLAFLLALFIKMSNLNVLVYTQSPDVAGSLFATSMASTFFVIYIWASFALSSFVMLHMQTKEQRINFLMVPATQVEKYLSRILLTAVVPLVGMVVLVLVADIFHMFLSLFIGTPGVTDHWIFPAFLHRFSLPISVPQMISPILAGIFSYVMFFWGQSLYVLGGCFWTKSAFLKTFGTLFLALIVMVIVISSSVVHHIEFLYNLNELITEWLHTHKWFSMNLALSLVTILFFWFTLLNYWLGYRLFSRVQIIRTKHFGR